MPYASLFPHVASNSLEVALRRRRAYSVSHVARPPPQNCCANRYSGLFGSRSMRSPSPEPSQRLQTEQRVQGGDGIGAAEKQPSRPPRPGSTTTGTTPPRPRRSSRPRVRGHDERGEPGEDREHEEGADVPEAVRAREQQPARAPPGYPRTTALIPAACVATGGISEDGEIPEHAPGRANSAASGTVPGADRRGCRS